MHTKRHSVIRPHHRSIRPVATLTWPIGGVGVAFGCTATMERDWHPNTTALKRLEHETLRLVSITKYDH